MKKNMISLLIMGAFIAPALADKPEWAGKGAPSADQKAAHESAMEAKGDYDDEGEKLKKQKKDYHQDMDHAEKMKHEKAEQLQKHQHDGEMLKNKEHSGELKGLEKQQAKKAEQTQKELGKGSEKGQAAREEHSKKWWKFWGE